MIYLGNGLYSDSGHSLMHYGVRGMRWARDKRETDVDWSNPTEVAAYYADKRGANDKRWNANGVNNNAAVRAVSIGRQGPLASVTKRGSGNAATAQQDSGSKKYIQGTQYNPHKVKTRAEKLSDEIVKANNYANRILSVAQDMRKESPVRTMGGYEYSIKRPDGTYHAPTAHDFSEARRQFGIPLAKKQETKKQNNGSFVTPRSSRDVRNKADTAKQPTGGFVAPRSAAERRAADDRARSPRGGFVAPRPGYVTKDQDDKKRSPKGGPHFATKEYQQEQANKRARTKSIRGFGSAQTAQISQKGHGTLAEANYNGGLIQKRDTRRGSGLYDSRGQMRYAAHKTTEATRAGVEAGRRRHRGDAGSKGYQTTSSQSDQGVNYDAGLKAARERARKNSQNKADTKHNQDKRGTGQRPNITNHPQTADTRTSQKNRGYQTTLTQQSNGVKYDAGLEAARKRALEKKKKKTKGEQYSKAKDWYFKNWVKKHLPGG